MSGPAFEPTYSVVITTYDRPGPLRACLAALARSDYPHERFEVVVVDDGGPAPLDAVVAEFRDRMALTLVRQANAGPASGRNHGARMARHAYLAFTDDDCQPEPGWLAALADGLRATPEALVGGRTVNGLPENPYSSASQLITDMVYAFYNADPAAARFFATNNLAVPAGRFREMGGLDERFRVSEDREFCDRWRHRGYPLTYEPRALVVHRHPLTLSSFWRQHFQYGRGAARFHQARGARQSGSLHEHIGFHLRLARWWRRARELGADPRSTFRVLPRVALWQVANASGYVCERLGL
jgi:GT2 family glycosyltransferase